MTVSRAVAAEGLPDDVKKVADSADVGTVIKATIASLPTAEQQLAAMRAEAERKEGAKANRRAARRAAKSPTLSAKAERLARKFGLHKSETVLLRAANAGNAGDQVAFLKAEDERRHVCRKQRWQGERDKREAIRTQAADELVASLKQRYPPTEIPTLIAWLDAADIHSVVAALRESASL
jgi:hypothetical protein